MIAGAGVQKYGTDIEKHQQLLLAVSDILIEIYMVESAILRTEKNINRYGLGHTRYAIGHDKTLSFSSR